MLRLALLLALLITPAFAQDLDSPRTGTGTPGPSALYSQWSERMEAALQQAIQSDSNWFFFQSWNDVSEAWADFTPAERTMFNELAVRLHENLVAAGLN